MSRTRVRRRVSVSASPVVAPPEVRVSAEPSAGHIGLLVVMVAAAFPLFAGLGRQHLWADEGDTAVLALSILKSGVPTAWDGVTFTDSDYGARVNDRLTMVGHPWVQYYAAAAAFALFGDEVWVARAPFALAGLLTLPALYFLVGHFTDRRTALTAVLMLATSLQFVLYARQARQYALNMLFTCLLFLCFVHLDKIWGRVLFGGVAVVLFHAHPLPALAALAALALLVVTHAPFRRYRRGLVLAVAGASLFALPWFGFAGGSLEQNTTPLRAEQLRWLWPRLIQFTIEVAAVTPAFGWLALAGVLAYRRLRARRAASLLTPGARSLLLMAGAFLAVTALMACLSLSAKTLWVVGTRHFCAVIPLGAAMSAILAGAVAGSNRIAHASLFVLLTATHLGRITPWALGATQNAPAAHSESVALHAPVDWKTALVKAQWPAFLRGLVRENPGTIAHVSRFLNENARAGDIVITNYEWEPLYFHTRLPQGLKIMGHYPVHERARRQGLPEYVFSVRGVRWIVWRWPWNLYREYDFERVIRQVEWFGGVPTLAAAFPETVWENRPEVVFHRFADKGHIFHQEVPVEGVTADVIRVDWPEPSRTGS